MNASQFLAEVRQSDLCPPDFERIYTEFQGYQQLAADTLREVHRLCEKHHIPYMLAFGSLLGAIRDGGQIPWDYDIDIFVSWYDRQKLADVLKTELSADYYFTAAETDPRCANNLTRICPVGYRSDVLHVDIFYFTGTSSDEAQRLADSMRIHELQTLRYNVFVDPITASYGSLRRFFGFWRRKLSVIGKSGRRIVAEHAELCSRYRPEESEYSIDTGLSAKMLFRTEDFCTPIPFRCELGDTYIPIGYEAVLQKNYGDWHIVPPLDRRLAELMEHYNKLSRFAKL